MSDVPHDKHRSGPRDMDVRAAVAAGFVLLGVSLVLLLVADEPVDATAIAGGTGVVLAASLLGLTWLARHWDVQRRGYVQTAVEEAQAEAVAGRVAGAASVPASGDAAAG